jgi:hypothetical protein
MLQMGCVGRQPTSDGGSDLVFVFFFGRAEVEKREEKRKVK